MARPDVVAIARETLGSRYGHQGRSVGQSLDCVGVPVYVAKRLGMTVPGVADYGRIPNPSEMRDALDAHLNRVSVSEMQFGDVAWIRFSDQPQHVAVIGDYPLGGFSLIHAYNGAGLNSVVEHRLDETWLRRIVALWRFPEDTR